MSLAASKNADIVNFQIGEEQLSVDREVLVNNSGFFQRIVSHPEFKGKILFFDKTDIGTFKTWLQFSAGNDCCINENNVFHLSALSKQIEAYSLGIACFQLLSKLPLDEHAALTFKTLDAVIATKDLNVKEYICDVLVVVNIQDYIARNKEHVKSLSAETKAFLLDLCLERAAPLKKAEAEQQSLEMKKLTQKSSILEAQLRKALEEIKTSREVIKCMNLVQVKIVTVTKQLATAEKKVEVQENDLDKIRTKLAAEKKKNETFRKKIQETMEVIKWTNKKFMEATELQIKSFESQTGEIRKNFHTKSEITRKSNVQREPKLREEIKMLKESIEQLRAENEALQPFKVSAGTSTDDLKLSETCSISTQPHSDPKFFSNLELLLLEQEWKREMNNIYYPSDVTATAKLLYGSDWKKNLIWSNSISPVYL